MQHQTARAKVHQISPHSRIQHLTAGARAHTHTHAVTHHTRKKVNNKSAQPHATPDWQSKGPTHKSAQAHSALDCRRKGPARTHTHTHTHAGDKQVHSAACSNRLPEQRAGTHTHTHTHTHARTHTHTHTHMWWHITRTNGWQISPHSRMQTQTARAKGKCALVF